MSSNITTLHTLVNNHYYEFHHNSNIVEPIETIDTNKYQLEYWNCFCSANNYNYVIGFTFRLNENNEAIGISKINFHKGVFHNIEAITKMNFEPENKPVKIFVRRQVSSSVSDIYHVFLNHVHFNM